jgi:hypothetical protein
MMPLFVGCPEILRRRLRRLNEKRVTRELQGLGITFYAENAQVDKIYVTTQTCDDISNQGNGICFSIDFKVDMSFDDYVMDPSALAVGVDGIFQSQAPLETFLGLGEIISSIEISSVTLYVPSESPSFGPSVSGSPSFNGQTFSPTDLPSSDPTQE